MPWHEEAMKDVDNCDKPRLAVAGIKPGISEWGNPLVYLGSCDEFIVTRSERREVKHLSTVRNRNQKRFR